MNTRLMLTLATSLSLVAGGAVASPADARGDDTEGVRAVIYYVFF